MTATNGFSPTDVALRLQRCLFEVLKLDLAPGALDDDTDLYELGLDSMSVVDILIGIETEFGLTIEVDELSADLFGKFGTLRRYIQSRVEPVDA